VGVIDKGEGHQRKKKKKKKRDGKEHTLKSKAFLKKGEAQKKRGSLGAGQRSKNGSTANGERTR